MSLSREMYNYINGPPPDPSKIRIAQNLDAAGRAYNESLRLRPSDDDTTTHHHTAINPSGNVTTPRMRAASESTRRPPHEIRSSVRQPVVNADPSRYATYTDSDRLVLPASSTHSRRRRRYSGLGSNGYTSYPRKEIRPKTTSGEHHTTTHQPSGSSYRSSTRSPDPRGLDMNDPFAYTNYREQSYADSDSFTKPRPSGRRSYIRGKKQRPLSMSGLDTFLPPVHYETNRDHRPSPTEKREDQRNKEGADGYRHTDHAGRYRHRGPVSLHQQRHVSPYREGYLSSRDGKEYSIRQSEDGTVVVDDRPYHGDRDRSHSISRRATEPERGRGPKYSQHLGPNDTPSGDGPSTANYRDDYSTEPSGTRRTRHDRHKHDKYAPDKSRLGSDVSEYDSDRSSRRYRHREPPRRGTLGSNGNPRRERRERRHRESGSDDSDSGSDTDRPKRPSTKTAHELGSNDTPLAGAGAREMQQRYSPLSKHGTPPKGNYKQPIQEMQQRPSPPSIHELPASPRESPKQPTKDGHLSDSPPQNPDTPPKGILKQPTRKFPEDPNAVREGVAPLKEEADKKGAPEGARWTKIRKSLVSPAALEGQERFEERTNDVIVLRVLSPEEIEAYSRRTAEIRYRYYRSRDRDRKDDSDYGDDDSYYDDTSSHDHDDDRSSQLTIESSANSTR